MEPALSEGDLVLGWRYFTPRAGQIVLAQMNGSKVVKRVVKVDADGLWLEGDNLGASTDSRQHGPIKKTHVVARVLYVVRGPGA